MMHFSELFSFKRKADILLIALRLYVTMLSYCCSSSWYDQVLCKTLSIPSSYSIKLFHHLWS